jgi:hypothetical protein
VFVIVGDDARAWTRTGSPLERREAVVAEAELEVSDGVRPQRSIEFLSVCEGCGKCDPESSRLSKRRDRNENKGFERKSVRGSGDGWGRRGTLEPVK